MTLFEQSWQADTSCGYGDSLTLDDITVDFSRYDWDNDDYGSSGRIQFKGSLLK